MDKKCKSYDHYRALSAALGVKCCNYILDTGKPRGCSPQDCDKWTARGRKPKTEAEEHWEV